MATPGSVIWTNYLNVAGMNDHPVAIACSPNSNIVVIGTSMGTVTAEVKITTAAYSGGGVLAWSRGFGGVGVSNAIASSLAIGSDGNVYVVGRIGGGSNRDLLVIGYNSLGDLLWSNRYGGLTNGDDIGVGIVTTSNGNVVVTGTSFAGGSSYNWVTISYSKGGVPLWTNRYTGIGFGENEPASIGSDDAGNVVVTGSSYGGGSGLDFVTVKYSSSGVPLWTNRYNGPGNGTDRAACLAIHTNGAVFVSGYSVGTGTGADCVVLSYSAAGLCVWTNRYDGDGSDFDEGVSIRVSSSGGVVVAGNSTDLDFRRYGTVLSFSNAGVPLWTNKYAGVDRIADFFVAAALDKQGNAYVVGSTYAFSTLTDFVSLGYSAAGVPLWTNRFDRSGGKDEDAIAITTDAAGDVYVLGYSSGVDYDFTIIKYSGVSEPIPLRIGTVGGGANYGAGVFGFGIYGPAGSNVVVEATSRLGTWIPLKTNLLSGGQSQFQEPLTGVISQRYYRVKLHP